MQTRSCAITLALGLTAFGGAAGATGPIVDGAPMQQVVDGAEVDGTSILTRTPDGVAMTLSTRQLERSAPYTVWWVIFNSPEMCAMSCGCGLVDLGDPAVEPGVFWATGRVTDRFGAATFAAETRVGELPDGDDQVLDLPGTSALLDPEGAEVHMVVRGHGKKRGGRLLEEQLTTFDGGCPPGECEDVQFAIHRSPACSPVG